MTSASPLAVSDIHQWLDRLENAVVAAEQALRAREWRDLGEAIAEQRRTTHGVTNAIEAAGVIAAVERAQIDVRVRTILDRRRSQIERLEEFHQEVGRRLRDLTKYKFALREMETEPISIALNVSR